jgi:hypothetical protein
MSVLGEKEMEGTAAERRVDQMLRASVVLEAPPDLSTRLLALAAPTAARPARLDAALKQALVMEAPPELAARLQKLVPTAAVQPRRKPWVLPMYLLTAVVAAVLLIVAGQMYGLALQQLGVSELWQAAAALPAEWLNRLYAVFPQGRYVVSAFLSLQRALQWVLIGLLMWAVLEMRSKRSLMASRPSLVQG